ncbi:MAG: hypothetical protein PVF65_10355 [Sphingomonadales bacterium]|jgi:hypothetical protein
MTKGVFDVERFEVIVKLQTMLHDAAWRKVLSHIKPEQYSAICDDVLSEHEAAFLDPLRDALEKLGLKGKGLARKALEHQIACHCREARAYEDIVGARMIKFEGLENVPDKGDKPIIVILPMTVLTADALAVLDQIRDTLLKDRPFIVYGDGMEAYQAYFPDHKNYFPKDTAHPTKEIRAVLEKNGVYFTYCDFNYAGKASIEGKFLGEDRSFSKGFVNLAATTKPHLLPLNIQLKDEILNVTISKGKALRSTKDDDAALKRVANSIAELLEAEVKKVGHQWLLLLTLTGDAEQMG